MSRRRERHTCKYRVLRERRGGIRIIRKVCALFYGVNGLSLQNALWDENPVIEYEIDSERKIANIRFALADMQRMVAYLSDTPACFDRASQAA